VRVPTAIADDLLAVLCEALSNVARHARATQVEVTIEAGEELVAIVTDDGIGVGVVHRRSGLANLSARASELGGILLLGPGDGGGARLEWRVPLAHSG
jgi:signal transduction histidine kinase